MAYTTNWKITNPSLAGVPPITDVSTTAKWTLGSEVEAVDRGANSNGAGRFKYVKGVASCVAGSWVVYYPDDYSTTLLVAAAVGDVGIAMGAMVAGTYGWIQISGKAVGLVAAGYTDNALVYATATPGTVDKTVVATDRVKNALGASAVDFPVTGSAEFEIDRPYTDHGAAS